MAHDSTAESTKRRLESSRRALMQNMMRNHTASSEPTHAEGGPDAESVAAAGAASEGVKGLWRTLRRTAKAWWRSHPAHLAVEVGQPLLDKYAAMHPLKLLAISAALGSAVVLAKPWRLISVTGLLIAALRSTQVSGLLASFLSREPHDPGSAGRH